MMCCTLVLYTVAVISRLCHSTNVDGLSIQINDLWNTDGCFSPTAARILKPCNGHGDCIKNSDEVGMDVCNCHPGFTGNYCHHNINDCFSYPCQNNGTCFDRDNDFLCKCSNNWFGKVCNETLPRSHYQDIKCLNGGTGVSNLVGDVKCRCTPEWRGHFCDEQIDQCIEAPCKNGGTCKSGPGWFQCLCAPGFRGDTCSNIDECSSSPCLGGGTCMRQINGFVCFCPADRNGTYCETLVTKPSAICPKLSSDKSLNNSKECNYCNCHDQSICSNLWCGLPNCAVQNETVDHNCRLNEVCVSNTAASCLSPPCNPRGDCRTIESFKRIGPPHIPLPSSCWPNQLVASDICSRILVKFDKNRIPAPLSVECFCGSLRRKLAMQIAYNDTYINDNVRKVRLVLICDLHKDTNDTIELALSTTSHGINEVAAVGEILKLLEKILRYKVYDQTSEWSKDIEESSPSALSIHDIIENRIEAETSLSRIIGLIGFILVVCSILVLLFLFIYKRQSQIKSIANNSWLSKCFRNEHRTNNSDENIELHEIRVNGNATEIATETDSLIQNYLNGIAEGEQTRPAETSEIRENGSVDVPRVSLNPSDVPIETRANGSAQEDQPHPAEISEILVNGSVDVNLNPSDVPNENRLDGSAKVEQTRPAEISEISENGSVDVPQVNYNPSEVPNENRLNGSAQEAQTHPAEISEIRENGSLDVPQVNLNPSEVQSSNVPIENCSNGSAEVDQTRPAETDEQTGTSENNCLRREYAILPGE